MNRVVKISIVTFFLGAGFSSHTYSLSKDTVVVTQQAATEWTLEALNKIDMRGVTREGNPRTVDVAGRRAVQFDGVRDGLFLDHNPLADLSQFTIEVIFWPDGKAPFEQRFLHMGQVQGERMLLETRVTTDDQWYLDAFIKSGDSSQPLIDKNKTHPTGLWYHVAFVVDGGIMNAYVNGGLELSGRVAFSPFRGGTTSIGVRMNRVSWFKGAIYKIRVTPKCLTPAEFMKP